MLRKRSRAVKTSKQAIVGDQSNLPWLSPEKPTKTISFFFDCPRIFKGFFTISSSSSSFSEAKSTMSPASILDTKPFSVHSNPSSFRAESKIPTPKTLSGNKHIWEQPNNAKGIGVALVDDISETINPSSTKQQKQKLLVLGSQLRIQVPPLPSSYVFPCFSPESPREFGIKTPRSQIQLRPFGNWDHQVDSEDTSEVVRDGISISEIEESEDYTCVISHGPNPKTTHIFGNCIVGSCCGVDGSSSLSSRQNGYLSPSLKNSLRSQSPESFLSFCRHCKKKLGQGKDIYMYRGEKPFCSQECRCQEMLFDGVES